MKKLFNLKNVLFILMVFVAIVFLSVNVFAEEVLGGATDITAEDYQKMQNTTSNTTNSTNTITNTTNTTTNTTNSINTISNVSKESTKLPQTGIEDYNIGILLIIGIASAIYAYNKINYYKNV